MQDTDPRSLEGRTVVGGDGDKIGKVEGVFLDDATNRPEWVAVKTGFFGGNVALVPLATATHSGDEIRVPYGKEQVKSAPHHDPDAALSAADEARLFDHYGVAYGGETVTALEGQGGRVGGVTETGTETRGNVGHDTSGPTTDDAMTRSEERLRVGTERVEAGRARLRKYVVTENVTQTVPVSREEVRIEREPITDANRGDAQSGPAISEEEHEVILHEERPVVAKETVPVERVRVDKETVTEEHQVSEELRKEQIDTTGTDTTGTETTFERDRDRA